MAITIDGTGTITGVSANGGLSAAQTGSVIQVVNATYATVVTSSTSTYVDTGLTATITPKFATSKILVIADQAACYKNNGTGNINLQLVRNSTALALMDGFGGYNTNSNEVGSMSINYLDSPATTSATTYKTQFNSSSNNANVQVQTNSSTSSITLMEIAG